MYFPILSIALSVAFFHFQQKIDELPDFPGHMAHFFIGSRHIKLLCRVVPLIVVLVFMILVFLRWFFLKTAEESWGMMLNAAYGFGNLVSDTVGSAKEGVKSVLPGSFNPFKWGVDSSATAIDQAQQ